MGFDAATVSPVASYVGSLPGNLADHGFAERDVLVAAIRASGPILHHAGLSGSVHLYQFVAVHGRDAGTEFNDNDDDLVYANYGLLYGPRFLLGYHLILGSYQRLPSGSDLDHSKPIQDSAGTGRKATG